MIETLVRPSQRVKERVKAKEPAPAARKEERSQVVYLPAATRDEVEKFPSLPAASRDGIEKFPSLDGDPLGAARGIGFAIILSLAFWAVSILLYTLV